jgi:hypothetical protein
LLDRQRSRKLSLGLLKESIVPIDKDGAERFGAFMCNIGIDFKFVEWNKSENMHIFCGPLAALQYMV